MATKKVEENKVSKKGSKKSSVDKSETVKVEKKSKSDGTKTAVNNKTVKEKNKKDDKKSERKQEEIKKVCPSCGKKYLDSLDECPKCGYSKSKNTMYDEEDFDDFEEYDDEEVAEDEKHDNKSLEKKNVVEKKKKEISNKKKYVEGKSSFKEQNDDLFDLFKILIIIVVLVFAVYLVIAFMNGEFKKEDDDTKKEEEVSASIQNEKILISSIFDKSENEYYVLIYDGSDEYWARYYNMIYDSYKSLLELEEDVLPMFWADLSDGFNSKYVVGEDGESNPDVKDDYKDLKVKCPTLIRVKKGKAVDYYEGDEVVDTLIDIVKSYNEEE